MNIINRKERCRWANKMKQKKERRKKTFLIDTLHLCNVPVTGRNLEVLNRVWVTVGLLKK
jgi:hypothetical protein